MKTKLILVMLLVSGIMYSQKAKKNGTVYNEHPAITAVESMWQDFYAGKADKVANYLADDFRSYDGTNTNKDDKGRDKEWFLGASKWVNENLSYISYKRSNGAYPDAIEYKGDDDGLWVQSWDHFKAMDNRTGAKFDMPIHRLYKMSSDNKIQTIITYDNDGQWIERRRSLRPRTNGTIYNHHENINTVMKMMGALENSDVEKAFSYFAEGATFTNLDMARDESHTVAEEKEMFKGLIANWTINSFDVVGYPDYLEYELDNAKVVQSWWNVRMTKKSDGKKMVLPLMLTHRFNDEGKIIRENGYYTMSSMK